MKLKLMSMLLVSIISFSLYAKVLVCEDLHYDYTKVVAYLEEDGTFYQTRPTIPGWKFFIWSKDAICSGPFPGLIKVETKMDQQSDFHFSYHGKAISVVTGETFTWADGFAVYDHSVNTMRSSCNGHLDFWVNCKFER